MFDILTYEKGAAVLRMLEQYLGPDTFRAGISSYVGKHAYANAETTDLWDAIEESARQPVRTMMDSWVFQPGHPLISGRRRRHDAGRVPAHLPVSAGRGRRHPALAGAPCSSGPRAAIRS